MDTPVSVDSRGIAASQGILDSQPRVPELPDTQGSAGYRATADSVVSLDIQGIPVSAVFQGIVDIAGSAGCRGTQGLAVHNSYPTQPRPILITLW